MHTRTTVANLVKRERRVRTHLIGREEWHDIKGKDGAADQPGYKRRLESSNLSTGWFWDP
jgi:hypothetical protein